MLKKLLLASVTTFALIQGASAQNVITPNSGDLIQIISPFNINPTLFYTTPALLGSGGAFTSLSVVGGTLASGANAFSLTATQPTTPIAGQSAVSWTITSAGSASQTNRGFLLSYAAGYTGSAITQAANFSNAAAGTGATLIPSGGSNAFTGNAGIVGGASATTTGFNAGVLGQGSGGNTSVGLLGLSQAVKNSGTNIGVVGSAVNTGSAPVMVGGWFSLNQTTSPATSAALVADNGAQTAAIAIFANNASTVATVNQTGGITATLTSATGTSTVCNSAGTSTLLTLVTSGTACAASAMRFKDAYPIEALNLVGLDALRTDVPWSYRRDSGTYENGTIHVGLIADDVEAMDPRCVVYDKEDKLLNYYDRCVLAYLVADRKALKARIVALEEKSR